jgi:hypothetical protein
MPEVNLADVSPDDLRRIVRLLRRRLAAILSAERVFAREFTADSLLTLHDCAGRAARLVAKLRRTLG